MELMAEPGRPALSRYRHGTLGRPGWHVTEIQLGIFGDDIRWQRRL
jgi:hypothetical protein